MTKTVIAIIPARMGSSRFYGKPMAKINGIPMIGHVYYRTVLCGVLQATYVATCDHEIGNYIESIGGRVIMTSSMHQRASDRTAEAMLKAEKELGLKVDIVVMVQGDEPMVTPSMIKRSLKPFDEDETVSVVNLMARLEMVEDFEDPNEPKVVVDHKSDAIYFSREPIPSRKKGVQDVPMYKQVCIIPFRRDYLIKFNKMPETELERIESIDMNRIIEHGEKVRMVMIEEKTHSVDTIADLEKVREAMAKDELYLSYKKKKMI